MRNLLGIIDLSEHAESLGELAAHRTLGAVPFGGRYRIIDFTLSNMVNAGIRNVGILLNDRFGPLLDHIKDGKEGSEQAEGRHVPSAGALRTDSGEDQQQPDQSAPQHRLPGEAGRSTPSFPAAAW